MNSFYIYLLEASIGLAFAHLMYRVFLRKHTKFHINRFFLLLFIGLSLSIPLVEFSLGISPHTALANGLAYVENLETGWGELALPTGTWEDPTAESAMSWISLIGILYSLGLAFFAIPILKSWKDLVLLISKTKKRRENGFVWLESPDAHSFSAFHYIFLGKGLEDLSKADQEQIIQHEKVHAKGLHSFDLLFIDILRILFWFHPLKNILKKDLQELHECIADARVAQTENKHTYSRLIVQLAHDIGTDRNHPLPVHSFAYSPIKHRIIMLLKKPTHSFRYLILPVLFGASIAIFSACDVNLEPEPSSQIKIMQDGAEIVEEIAPTILVSMKVEGSDEVFEMRIDETFISPIENSKILSAYGMRVHPIEKVKKLHHGIDLRAAVGTPIQASASGTVVKANTSKKGYGNHIVIQHLSGMSSIYAQLSELKVRVGQEVKQGEIIALSGNSGASTGPHLHFEIRKDGKSVDPEKYIQN